MYTHNMHMKIKIELVKIRVIYDIGYGKIILKLPPF